MIYVNPYAYQSNTILPALELDAAVGVTKDGANRVSQWDDRNGSGISAVQGIASAQPLWIDDVLNNSPVIHFNLDYLDVSATLGKPGHYTVMVVGAIDNIEDRGWFCGSVDSAPMSVNTWGGIGNRTLGNLPGADGYTFGNGTDFSIGRTTSPFWEENVYVLSSHRYSSGNTVEEIWRNGIPQSVSPNTTNASNCSGTAYGYSLGRLGQWNDGRSYLTCHIAHYVCYNSILSDPVRQSKENELLTAYAL